MTEWRGKVRRVGRRQWRMAARGNVSVGEGEDSKGITSHVGQGTLDRDSQRVASQDRLLALTLRVIEQFLQSHSPPRFFKLSSTSPWAYDKPFHFSFAFSPTPFRPFIDACILRPSTTLFRCHPLAPQS